MSNWTLQLLIFNACDGVFVSFPFSFNLSFNIASNQLVRFSKHQPDSVDDIAFPSHFPSLMAIAASPIPGGSHVAPTLAFFTFPALATESPLQAVSETSSEHVIIKSPIQVFPRPIGLFLRLLGLLLLCSRALLASVLEMTSVHRPLNGFVVVRIFRIYAWKFLRFMNCLLSLSRELLVVSVRLTLLLPYLRLRLPYLPQK